MGSSLSGSTVTAVSRGVASIVNPLTTNGLIVAAGPTGRPVVASTYPEWIAGYMLNVAVFPLPVSFSNLLAYLFPVNMQAFYDEILEGAFEARVEAAFSQASLGLGARSLGLSTVLVVVVDALCATGFVLYALASGKAFAALLGVGAVAWARRKAWEPAC